MAEFFWEDIRAQEIKSLRDLLHTLISSSYEQLEIHDLMQSAQIQYHDIRQLAAFSESHYARLLIAGGDSFQLLLLCWKAGQFSPIHDHGQSVCAVKVLQGIATEITYGLTKTNTLLPVASQKFFTGSVTTSRGGDVHQFGNAEGDDLVTLHCYAPPLYDMRKFSLDETIFAADKATAEHLPIHKLHEKTRSFSYKDI